MSQANALAARVRFRHRFEKPWAHPAVAGRHVVSRTRDRAGGEVFSVATCQCGWINRVELAESADQELAIAQHWRDIIGSGDLAA